MVTPSRALGLAFCVAALGSACARESRPADDPSSSSGAAPEGAEAPAGGASRPPTSKEGEASSKENLGGLPPTPGAPLAGWPLPTSCGALTCYAFASPRAAVEALLHRTQPLVIGFGEAHAPAGFTGKPTVRRFAEEILPALAPQSSSLVVELLAPPSGCKEAEAATREQSEAITTGQAESNQSDYLKLGHAASALGVVPDVLRASCADLEAIRAAGDDGLLVILETIARLTVDVVTRELERTKATRPLVLAYGGALHNDVAPREGRESWSYAARLEERTKGRYVELDLVVPELARDTESWRAFRWYDAYRALALDGPETWLIESGRGSYALVFPRSTPPGAPPEKPPQSTSK